MTSYIICYSTLSLLKVSVLSTWTDTSGRILHGVRAVASGKLYTVYDTELHQFTDAKTLLLSHIDSARSSVAALVE
jgi:hypothetical protein